MLNPSSLGSERKRVSNVLHQIAIQAKDGTLPPPWKGSDLSKFFEPQQQAQKQEKGIGDVMVCKSMMTLTSRK